MELSLTKFENIHGVSVKEAFRKNAKNKKDRRGDDLEDAGNRSDDEEKNVYAFNGMKR